MSNPAPGFAKHPQHTVNINAYPGNITVNVGAETIAQSDRALELQESNYPAAYYVPLEDVVADNIVPSSHQTYCPFKGHATYWSIHVNGTVLEDAVWGYMAPYDECAAIKGYVAFYPNKVSITTA